MLIRTDHWNGPAWLSDISPPNLKQERKPRNSRGRMRRTSLILLLICLSSTARAEVLFQNAGNPQGWESLFTQKAGTINEVTSPVYKGKTAMKTTQTYQSSDGNNYHSEMIHRKAHLAGQDL